MKVTNEVKVSQVFDMISYQKGSAIVRMIFGYIGSYEKFRECMRVYMDRFKYSNASTSDLFRVMNEVSGKKVSFVFNFWI